jgi:hypothetical protein
MPTIYSETMMMNLRLSKRDGGKMTKRHLMSLSHSKLLIRMIYLQSLLKRLKSANMQREELIRRRRSSLSKEVAHRKRNMIINEYLSLIPMK